jgi:hypothetical protein
MLNAAILMPCAALAVLTFVVMLTMYARRISEMKAERIAPQSIALSQQAATALKDTRAADNYRNLFELPVLFYALCLALASRGEVPLLFIVGAWLFVALRIVHSAIQVGSNRVMQRFRVFSAGAIVLFALWIAFAIDLLRA